MRKGGLAAFVKTVVLDDGYRPRGGTAGKTLVGLAFAVALAVAGSAAHAASNKVRISGLADVSFGTLGSLTADAVQSQSLCLFADTASNGYNVTATGQGPAGSFQLVSGASPMIFEVQWSSASGQSSGTPLLPNVPLTGQSSSATQQTCNNGPATSASLIVILRGASLASARAGTYTGSLTLLVGPE